MYFLSKFGISTKKKHTMHGTNTKVNIVPVPFMPHPKLTGNIIGTKLREARKVAGLTQTQLSAALNVDFGIELAPDLISRIESHERTVRDKELVALARILETDPHSLLGWGEE